MDGKNDKTSEVKLEVKVLAKTEPVIPLNGVVVLNSGYVTNGYSSKVATDNDGSGSESGYTTPKKRKARRGGTKAADGMTRDRERASQRGSFCKQELEASGKADSSRPDGSWSCLKEETYAGARRPGAPEGAPLGEMQRKASDGRSSGAPGKKPDDKAGKAKVNSSMTSREDSWTLFKPPPVFPVDNSSAKIVPKISYASKVKENLNKAAQASVEMPPPQVPIRLAQVPMSAVKTINSASFANGPLPGDGHGCPAGGTYFNSAASSALSASSNTGGENVASSPNNNNNNSSSSINSATTEPRKSSLFVYPSNPLNMQPVLPSARQPEPPAAQTNQKVLGDIFQNQWGLSFINEPNTGPDGAAGQLAEGLAVAEVTFQGDACGPSTHPDPEAPPPVQRSEKRTSGPSGVPEARRPSASPGGACRRAERVGPDEQGSGRRAPEASPKAPRNEPDSDPAPAPVANDEQGPARAQAHTKGRDEACGWGAFDLKDAILYHTKEFEHISTLQKQDPTQVVLYSKAMDAPDE